MMFVTIIRLAMLSISAITDINLWLVIAGLMATDKPSIVLSSVSFTLFALWIHNWPFRFLFFYAYVSKNVKLYCLLWPSMPSSYDGDSAFERVILWNFWWRERDNSTTWVHVSISASKDVDIFYKKKKKKKVENNSNKTNGIKWRSIDLETLVWEKKIKRFAFPNRDLKCFKQERNKRNGWYFEMSGALVLGM